MHEECDNRMQVKRHAKDNEVLLRRGLLLEYITLGWNFVGTFFVIAAAWAARSASLAGFGLDSLVEIGASLVVVWQLRDIQKLRERRALRFVAIAFLLLAIYVAGQSTYVLWFQIHPASSPLGIFWLAFTFVLMLVLALGKRITGTQLNNPVLQTEARVTLIDAWLAGAVLVGLILNAAFGWWWADPLAGLIIVVYGLKEGHHAWIESKHRS